MYAENELAGEWAQRKSKRVCYGFMTGSNEVRDSRNSGVYYIIGWAVKWGFFVSGQTCWGKSSKFSSILDFEQRTIGKNAKPAFYLSSEAFWKNLKFSKDL